MIKTQTTKPEALGSPVHLWHSISPPPHTLCLAQKKAREAREDTVMLRDLTFFLNLLL